MRSNLLTALPASLERNGCSDRAGSSSHRSHPSAAEFHATGYAPEPQRKSTMPLGESMPDSEPIPGEDKIETLRDRQRQVLHGLARGLSEKQVATELGISHNTVHAHVKELHRHFTVSSRGELLSLFLDRRVIQLLSRKAG